MTTMRMKLELVIVPVSDVDRAKAFYTEKLGFHADFDQRVNENLRFVQLTPEGSAVRSLLAKASLMQPGSLEGLQMVVEDARAIREELINEALWSVRLMYSHGGILSTSAILLGIAGPCSSPPLPMISSEILLSFIKPRLL